MSPEMLRKFEDMEKRLAALERVENVPFIENAKRRITEPLLEEGIEIQEVGTTTGMTTGVDEGGVATYDVAKEFDGSITIIDPDGNTYKLGYYTP